MSGPPKDNWTILSPLCTETVLYLFWIQSCEKYKQLQISTWKEMGYTCVVVYRYIFRMLSKINSMSCEILFGIVFCHKNNSDACAANNCTKPFLWHSCYLTTFHHQYVGRLLPATNTKQTWFKAKLPEFNQESVSPNNLKPVTQHVVYYKE